MRVIEARTARLSAQVESLSGLFSIGGGEIKASVSRASASEWPDGIRRAPQSGMHRNIECPEH